MALFPAASAAVVQAAVREAESGTAEQPAMAVPFAVKPTVPVGMGGPAGATVAVNVTGSPTVEGLAEDTSVVVVGILGGINSNTVPQPPAPLQYTPPVRVVPYRFPA